MTNEIPFIVFTPNKPSAGEVLVDAKANASLHAYLKDHFYYVHEGQQYLQPITAADDLLETIKSAGIGTEELESLHDYPAPKQSLQAYLENVGSNFGEQALIACTHFTG